MRSDNGQTKKKKPPIVAKSNRKNDPKENAIIKTNLVTTLLSSILLLLAALPANAQSTNTDFQQAVADYQRSPSYAAAEKVIGLAREINPPPAIPEDAERFMVRGQAAVESAKEPGDFKDAAVEFEKSALAAPWNANAYYNLGVVYDKEGNHQAAISNLKLYLLAAPNSDDAKKVKDLIYKIEFKQEKALKEETAKAQESSPEVVAAKKKKDFDDWLNGLQGARYVFHWMDGQGNEGYNTYTINGARISGVLHRIKPSEAYQNLSSWEITGRIYDSRTGGGSNSRNVYDVLTFSDDGKRLTREWHYYDNGGTEVFVRER